MFFIRSPTFVLSSLECILSQRIVNEFLGGNKNAR
uniref:Uncharacterized protein n=1 Tax=Dulem virus 176 TaxID=3145653 RepID=A0AAU8B4U7_9VIRU